MDTHERYNYSPLSGLRSTSLIMLYSSKDLDNNAPLASKLVEINTEDSPPYQAVPLSSCRRMARLLHGFSAVASSTRSASSFDSTRFTNDEESVQIAMMSTIYRGARDVVV
ncbi:putative HET domain-containing protein [Colletotrichum higginsianum]|nr:putative HET domain-containing protein [Colletotrichum higginsianum]